MKYFKNKKLFILILILAIVTSMFFVFNKKTEYKELPRVKLKEQTNLKQFALMLEQTKGKKDYQESNEDLPTEGYKYNKEKSGCVDINGKVVEDVLDYDYDTYTVLLDTSKTLYCYLYYDIADFKVYASLDTDTTGTKYRSSEYKNKIVSASFVSKIPSAEELKSLVYWDLSDTTKGTKENSVIGWLEETGEGTDQYNLYIGSRGSIYTVDLSYAFQGISNLQEINFDNLNTSETTNISGMFKGCNLLNSLDLNTFDTSKVTDMSEMFYGVTADLPFKEWPNFVTSNVEDMSWMFFEYQGTSLNLSSFDTSKVTDMSWMFKNVTAELPFQDWPNFVTSNVEGMSSMFSGYQGTSLNLSSFDTSKLTYMNSMFSNYKGTTLDLSSFTFDKVIAGGYGNAQTFSQVLPSCEVKIKSSQQTIFEIKFPLGTSYYDRQFTPTYVD